MVAISGRESGIDRSSPQPNSIATCFQVAMLLGSWSLATVIRAFVKKAFSF